MSLHSAEGMAYRASSCATNSCRPFWTRSGSGGVLNAIRFPSEVWRNAFQRIVAWLAIAVLLLVGIALVRVALVRIALRVDTVPHERLGHRHTNRQGALEQLGQRGLANVAEVDPSCQQARPHVTVTGHGQLAVNAAAAELIERRLLILHPPPDLTQTIDIHLSYTERAQLSNGTCHILAIVHGHHANPACDAATYSLANVGQ